MTSTEIVREVTRGTGGPAIVCYVAFLLPDAQTAQTLGAHPDIGRAVAQIRASRAPSSGWARGLRGSASLYDAMASADGRRLTALGAVAEVSGIFPDTDGQVVGQEPTARMVTNDAVQLAQVAEHGDVLAIPYGTDKAPAVHAVVRSGLVTTMVTHTAVARELLR